MSGSRATETGGGWVGPGEVGVGGGAALVAPSKTEAVGEGAGVSVGVGVDVGVAWAGAVGVVVPEDLARSQPDQMSKVANATKGTKLNLSLPILHFLHGFRRSGPGCQQGLESGHHPIARPLHLPRRGR